MRTCLKLTLFNKIELNVVCVGINPENKEHGDYLKKMTDDFVNVMCSKIEKAIQEHAKSHKIDPLYEECIQHILFCQAKCQNFYGREETLQV